jgi:hypothetical protein
MSLFEKAKQLRFTSPAPGSAPSRFNPSARPIPTFRRPVAVKKTAPEKPKTLFQQKKDWERVTFKGKIGEGMLESQKKRLSEIFSQKSVGYYVSEKEAKQGLKKLKKEGYRAEKLRKALEGKTGLKGKY